MTPHEIAERAAGLAKDGLGPDEVEADIESAAGGDRQLIEAARDEVAARIRAAVDDYDATATLTLLNRTLSQMPRHDPMDWRVRWARHRKP
jgi:hypothetical protein